jgi:5-formyltetrahydrofolate cyclo-ligase
VASVQLLASPLHLAPPRRLARPKSTSHPAETAFLLYADVTDEKRVLRVTAAAARRTAHGADAASAADAVRRHFLAKITLAPRAVVGGYWPIGTELDARPLMTALHERGHVCGLPVSHRGQPLNFHVWSPDAELVPGIFNTKVPPAGTPEIDPDVLVMPLLAFDARGTRLGYGGGYYDRTIPAIRSRKPVLAVGVAYAVQEVRRIPSNRFDQRLDWIVTEKEARRFERRRFPWLRQFWTS